MTPSCRVEIERVCDDNYSVYGARKVWRQLNREGVDGGPLPVERLDAPDGSAPAGCAARKRRTTIPG